LQAKLRQQGAEPGIDIERLGLLDGDTIVLCTTGLTNVADDAALTKVLAAPGHSADEQCILLADLAANRAVDDVTVLIGRYRITERT